MYTWYTLYSKAERAPFFARGGLETITGLEGETEEEKKETEKKDV